MYGLVENDNHSIINHSLIVGAAEGYVHFNFIPSIKIYINIYIYKGLNNSILNSSTD